MVPPRWRMTVMAASALAVQILIVRVPAALLTVVALSRRIGRSIFVAVPPAVATVVVTMGRSR